MSDKSNELARHNNTVAKANPLGEGELFEELRLCLAHYLVVLSPP